MFFFNDLTSFFLEEGGKKGEVKDLDFATLFLTSSLNGGQSEIWDSRNQFDLEHSH